MFRQIAVFFIVMIITLQYSVREISKKNCIIAVSIVMTVLCGLRTWWSGDLIKYYTLYCSCNSDEWREAVFGRPSNVGLRLLFRISGILGGSYEGCLFIIALFSAITLGILIYRYSPSPYWSYLMYIAMGFYLFTFSGLKQAIAMSFLVIAMMMLLENKVVQFILFVIIAGIFHAPALIFFLAYPFCKFKMDVKFFLITIVFIILVVVNRNQIADFLGEMYYDTEKGFTASEIIGGRAIMMMLIIVAAQFLRPLRNEDTIYRKVFVIMILALVAQLFSVFNNVFTRLSDYFYQFVVLYIPLMLDPTYYRLSGDGKEKEYTRDNDIGLIISVAITAFSVWYYFWYLSGSTSYLNSIKFFWEIDAHSLYGA